jgi:PAS domain S-box-containing protein
MAETAESARVLIVDDTPQHREILRRVLGDYDLAFASDGLEALQYLEAAPPPDLILLDVMMPGENGFEVCRRIKANERLRDIPVIFVTSLGDRHEAGGLALGAADYITKPFDHGIVRARVRTHLALKGAKERLARHNALLEEQVAAGTAQLADALKRLQDGSLETIFRLSCAAEYRDEDTGQHVLRVSYYSAAIARQIGLAEPAADVLLRAAPMHDVGKIGIPDHVLLKRGALDANEWKLMQRHTLIGAKILAGSHSEAIKLAEVVALTHHERWDGRGYPEGLSGTAIPIAGRVVAVADVFDALSSRRPYKQAYSLDMSFAMIRDGRGTSFDPAVVDAFLGIQDEILEIRASYRDNDTGSPDSRPGAPITAHADAVEIEPPAEVESLPVANGKEPVAGPTSPQRLEAPGESNARGGRAPLGRVEGASPAPVETIEPPSGGEGTFQCDPPCPPEDDTVPALLRSSPDAIVATDQAGRITFWNRAAEHLFAYSEREALGRNASELVPERYRARYHALFRPFPEAVEPPSFVTTCEGYVRRKDGSEAPVEASVSTWTTTRGLGYGYILRGTAGRQRDEEALRRSEGRFRALVKNATYGIYRSSLDGKFIEVNDALASMLGYASEEDLMAAGIASVYADPGERAHLVERYCHAGRIERVEVQWKRRDGGTILVSLTGHTVYDNKGVPEGFDMIAEDVTARRQLEEQLRHAQKVEAVARLTGGIAHDFNNLLSAIIGYSDLVLEQVDADGPLRADVEAIRNAGEAAASLTRQLLAFSRKQVLAPVVLDLNATIRDVDQLLRRAIGEHIRLTTDLAQDLHLVMADPGQIQQAIINLVVNARDAMPRGGTLRIETANVENGPRPATSAAADRFVALSVTDTGSGMTPEVQAHLFEPFFTTKGAGKGTGLGLSTVHGIVQQSGGHISVRSEPGVGTCFTIHLPRIDATVDPAGPHPAADLHGTETILLVEDDDRLRTLAARILRGQGYTLLEARGASESTRISDQYDGQIDLLLTDMVMPGGSGRSLAEWLQPVRPNLKVLYTSGHTADECVQVDGSDPTVAFLQKPYTPVSLARKVREVLGVAPSLN